MKQNKGIMKLVIILAIFLVIASYNDGNKEGKKMGCSSGGSSSGGDSGCYQPSISPKILSNSDMNFYYNNLNNAGNFGNTGCAIAGIMTCGESDKDLLMIFPFYLSSSAYTNCQGFFNSNDVVYVRAYHNTAIYSLNMDKISPGYSGPTLAEVFCSGQGTAIIVTGSQTAQGVQSLTNNAINRIELSGC